MVWVPTERVLSEMLATALAPAFAVDVPPGFNVTGLQEDVMSVNVTLPAGAPQVGQAGLGEIVAFMVTDAPGAALSNDALAPLVTSV